MTTTAARWPTAPDDILPGEEWRAVPGYEGYYEASSLGRVRALPRVVQQFHGPTRRRGLMLKMKPNGQSGYPEVRLSKNGKSTHFSVHRLVLMAFVGPPPEGMVGCHADDNKLNNSLANLRWDTYSANVRDCIANGNHAKASRTSCHKGHPYDNHNTVITKAGHRKCRECARLKSQATRDRKRAETQA